MMNPQSLKNAYNRLREIYTDKELMRNYKFRMRNNPEKRVFDIAGNVDCITCCTNVMSASLNKANITKVISIDDFSGKSNEVIVYTDKRMRTTVRENIGLTSLRCGIMATLAAELNYPLAQLTRVGFIGNGNINQTIMEVLHKLFNINSCVIRGSEKDRSKNKEIFEDICQGKVVVDDTDDLSLLNQCDIVFCCTNSFRKENMISKKDLSNPRLLVVLDSGYLLDESFRKGFERINYTDHSEQLHNHYESEFPYDKNRRYFSTMHEDKSTSKKAVYLYGVAIADLIVFEEFFLEDNQC